MWHEHALSPRRGTSPPAQLTHKWQAPGAAGRHQAPPAAARVGLRYAAPARPHARAHAWMSSGPYLAAVAVAVVIVVLLCGR